MKGYSYSKEDYLDLLIKKYPMKEAIFIEGEACSKCHMIKPHVEKRAESNGYEFHTYKFDDASVKEFDVQAVPMLVLKDEEVHIYNDEGIVGLISNK